MLTDRFFLYMETEQAKYVPLPSDWRESYAAVNMTVEGNLLVSDDPMQSGYKVPKGTVSAHLTTVKEMYPDAIILVDKRKYKTVQGAMEHLCSLYQTKQGV